MEAQRPGNPKKYLKTPLIFLNFTETIFHKIVLFMYSKSKNRATFGFMNIYIKILVKNIQNGFRPFSSLKFFPEMCDIAHLSKKARNL